MHRCPAQKQLIVIRSLCIYAVLPHFEGRGAPRQRQKADPSQPEKAGLHKKAASATDGEAAFL